MQQFVSAAILVVALIVVRLTRKSLREDANDSMSMGVKYHNVYDSEVDDSDILHKSILHRSSLLI